MVVYYKNMKVSNLLMKNNLSSGPIPDSSKSHIIYKFQCNLGQCLSCTPRNTYIGLTTMTLKDRMSAHRYKGSIFEHFRTQHGISPNLDELLRSTKILYRESDVFQLHIFEALHIRKYKPTLNENTNDFTCLKLKIFQYWCLGQIGFAAATANTVKQYHLCRSIFSF